jgi:hypothetical protein
MMTGWTRLLCTTVAVFCFAGTLSAAPEKKPRDANEKIGVKPGGKAPQVGENVCGANKEQSRNNETKTQCSKDPCPPNAMQDCRRVAATCMNPDGKGNYQAYGAWECVDAVKKDPAKMQPAK